jgi:hypothetical protein
MDTRSRCLVSHHKDLGVGTVYTSTMLINQHDVAVFRNYVQALVAPITTQANLSPEAGRESTARICASWIGSRRWSDRKHNNQTDSHSAALLS